MASGRYPRKKVRASLRINIALTPDERSDIEKRATEIGMTPGAFMRFMSLHGTISKKLFKQIKSDLTEISYDYEPPHRKGITRIPS